MKNGWANATDRELLAGLCQDAAMLGAYSPKMLLAGAIKRGLTAREFASLVASKDPMALDDLQWA